MIIRMIGAGLTLLSGGGYALAVAREHRQKEESLEELIRILDHLASELDTYLTPLPTACNAVSEAGKGPVSAVFIALSGQLQRQQEVNAAGCMKAALKEVPGVPEAARERLVQLGDTLGRYDLEGQLRGIRATQQLCRRDLESLAKERTTKVKSYQTLGFCTGAAIAILLL